MSNTKTSVSVDEETVFVLPPSTTFFTWGIMSLASASLISEFSSGVCECASPQNISQFPKLSV